ncbi:MAG: YgiQ family radical SAM protein [Endomicrobiales bacterium]|nr:YgiQ family radical SAM protein [Endomicrobiales bacterium]
MYIKNSFFTLTTHSISNILKAQKTKKEIMFLPTNLTEAKGQGINELDVVLISADAYIDHPSFAPALIGRFLQSLGLSVGIIAQPNWHNKDDFMALGRPKLFFGVTAGNIDSMVSLYTPQRKIRSQDAYTENGEPGKKPYLPTIVYTNRIKEAFKDVAVVIGGIEASLRRIAHFDFYTDKVRPSIILDSKADVLIYGNGEAPLRELVVRLKAGEQLREIKNIAGTVVPLNKNDDAFVKDVLTLPSFEEVKDNKATFANMTKIVLENQNPYNAKPMLQHCGTRRIIINPPAFPLSTKEIDEVYALQFERKAHPKYKGKIPALEMIGASISAHRGCYGGCSFCTLYMHQGKFIQSRSKESIKKEVRELIKAGCKVITDIGGPTANMYGTFCTNEIAMKNCKRPSCLFPSICKNLNTTSSSFLGVLKDVSMMEGIKSLYVNSGVRYDLALLNPEFVHELAINYTQGQLSVAPEHCDEGILNLMHKPKVEIFENFLRLYRKECALAGKKQFVIPYLIVGHPGATDKTESKIKNFVARNELTAEQMQEFYPTPMSLSTAMYYTGLDIYSGKEIVVSKKLSTKKLWKNNTIKAGFKAGFQPRGNQPTKFVKNKFTKHHKQHR